MKGVPLVILAVVAVTAVTACGSSHRRGVSGDPRLYQRYSVRQVEAVFARHGIRLHESGRQMPRSVALRYGRAPHFIAVYVSTGGKLGGLQYLGWTGSPRPRFARRGNVLAASDPGHFATVKSALAELH